nr:type VI secretion system contractile sheath large subunit [Limobrevibacterium gyesilva]
MRDAVLSGRFFGAAHGQIAEALAGFIAGAEARPLASWFGPTAAARLAADRDALRGAIDRDIAAIDASISAQLDAVLHADRLSRLEGSWRGLAWLVDGIEPAARVKVRILNVSWSEICRDLERAAEFDQSHLFRRIYEDEFGTPGGEPFGMVVVDHEVRHRRMPGYATDDVAALSLLAGVAAAAFAPMVLAASPTLLEVGGFDELATVHDPAASFRGTEHARWRGLSSREDMRFLALTLPRVLARSPWPDDPARADGFRYCEYAPDVASRVWTTAGYAFAFAVVRAYANHGWPADVRGTETDQRNGGLVDELPAEAFSPEPRSVWVRPSLDVVLTDRQERSLVEAGLMPLSALPFGEQAMFGAVRSLQAPAQFNGANAAAANANARISAQLNSMLCVSRFAHYLKMKGREMVGSFQRAEDIESRLQAWLSSYVNAGTGASQDALARFPLVSARVLVKERAGKPGVFGCVIHLQPQFQLDDVSATFRLVTDIVAPGAKA